MRFNTAGIEPGPLGGVLVFRDYNRPIKARHAGPCGPYYRPGIVRADQARGIGGYLRQMGAFGGLELDEGAGVRLRVVDVDGIELAGRLGQIRGYFAEDDGDSFRPFVALLPHGAGYLAGWGFGAGMCASFDRTIWQSITEAAVDAHRIAQRAAEDEAAYQDQQRQDEAEGVNE